MEIKKLQQQADDLRNSGRTKDAIKIYQQLVKLYEVEKDYFQAGSQIQMIGVSYKIDNDTKRAVSYLSKAAEYFKKYGIVDGLGNTLRDIGITYEYIGDYEKAKKYLEESAKVLKDSKDKAANAITLAKIGLVKLGTKNYFESEKYFKKAIKILEKTDHWFFYSTALWHVGQLYVETKKYKQAISVLEKAAKILDDNNQQKIHTRRYAQYWGLMANAYANSGEIKEAKKYFQKSKKIIESGNFSLSAKKVILKDIKFQETQKLLIN